VITTGLDALAQREPAIAREFVELRDDPQQQIVAVVDGLGRAVRGLDWAVRHSANPSKK